MRGEGDPHPVYHRPARRGRHKTVFTVCTYPYGVRSFPEFCPLANFLICICLFSTNAA